MKDNTHNGQFVVLEKHDSNLSDSVDVYYAKNESDEKRAILLLPIDTTKLLIDAKGKLTLFSDPEKIKWKAQCIALFKINS